eukprot:363931-Chlamydomonas_euryale.AAC.5
MPTCGTDARGTVFPLPPSASCPARPRVPSKRDAASACFLRLEYTPTSEPFGPVRAALVARGVPERPPGWLLLRIAPGATLPPPLPPPPPCRRLRSPWRISSPK